MKGLAVVYRRTLEAALHDQADEADQDQDEHRRGRDQRNRQDRPSDLSFARLAQWSSPSNSQKPRTVAARPSNGSTDTLWSLEDIVRIVDEWEASQKE